MSSIIINEGITFGATRHSDQICEDEINCYHLDQDRDLLLGYALSQYNLNYQFDKEDIRDFKFSSTLLKDIDPNSLPKSVDFRGNWGEILDQGSLGSCVSNSVAYQLRYLSKKNINLSRLYIYYNGRVLAKYPIDKDTGLTMRGGFASVADKGVVEETLYPYIISKYTSKPSDLIYEVGEKNKSIAYYSVNQDINQIKKCLKDGFAVSFGIAVYSSFMSTEVAKTGKVPVPDRTKENRIGGHALTIVGYNETSFIVCNSWGQKWGDKGFCYFPYSVILDNKLVGDLWTLKIFTFTPNNIPAPIPIQENWAPNVQYPKGTKVKYLGFTYICLISHKSISVWNPGSVPVLWAKI